MSSSNGLLLARGPWPPERVTAAWREEAFEPDAADTAAADAALAALRAAGGEGEFEQAAVIGEVKTQPPGMVLVETAFGGKRVMDQLVGDPLPRIC